MFSRRAARTLRRLGLSRSLGRGPADSALARPGRWILSKLRHGVALRSCSDILVIFVLSVGLTDTRYTWRYIELCTFPTFTVHFSKIPCYKYTRCTLSHTQRTMGCACSSCIYHVRIPRSPAPLPASWRIHDGSCRCVRPSSSRSVPPSWQNSRENDVN